MNQSHQRTYSLGLHIAPGGQPASGPLPCLVCHCPPHHPKMTGARPGCSGGGIGVCISRVPCPGRTGGRQQTPANIGSIFSPSWSCLVSLTRESFLLKPVQLQLPTAFSGVPKRPSAVSVALSDASGQLPVMFPFLDPKLKPFKPGPGSSLPTISLLVSLFLEDPGMLFSSSSFSSA